MSLLLLLHWYSFSHISLCGKWNIQLKYIWNTKKRKDKYKDMIELHKNYKFSTAPLSALVYACKKYVFYAPLFWNSFWPIFLHSGGYANTVSVFLYVISKATENYMRITFQSGIIAYICRVSIVATLFQFQSRQKSIRQVIFSMMLITMAV